MYLPFRRGRKQFYNPAIKATMHTARFADLMAIPFFLAAILYFAQKEEAQRSPIEDALLLFSTGGLVADLSFVFLAK